MKNLRRTRKNILSRDAAHALLNPHYDDLLNAIQKGLNEFALLASPLRLRARHRTLAGLLNDCICYEASHIFEGVEGALPYEDYESWFFLFGEKAALRFKKVGESLQPSNIQTRRQQRIGDQQGELPGVEIATVVNVGYKANKLFTEIKSVGLSCFYGDSLLWEIPLADAMQAYIFDNDGNANTIGAPVVHAKIMAAEGTSGQ